MGKAEWMSGKYGVMVHYLSRVLSQDGSKKMTPDEMADNFDVKAFADSVQKMGASWVIFPIGQNSGYYWSENPYVEEKIAGRCTKRDLIMDIANELTQRDIRFIAYLPTEMDAQAEDMRKAFGWDLSSDKKEFMANYVPVVKYWAQKLGTKLSGWWFDGNYTASEKGFLRTHDWDNNRFNKEEWMAAAKAGNPDAIVAMCTGANHMGSVYEDEEYLPGEANELNKYPWDYDSTEKQWHMLTWLDCFWAFSAGAAMPDPKYSNKQLYEYVRECLDKKGAVTLNIGIFEDGTLAEKTVAQVEGLKVAVSNKYYNKFRGKLIDSINKFEIHMKKMPSGSMPIEVQGCRDGKYYDHEKGSDLSNFWNWMASFITGLAPIYYQSTKNEKYLKWANSFEKHYHDKMFGAPVVEAMHDIGFLYSPYSVAMYKLTGDEKHLRDAVKAADEIAKRFDVNGKYIDAWNRMDEERTEGRAIVDCMMNVALLLWAWKETGNTFYRDIAEAHATTVKNVFVREDMSVAHSFDFDKKTGKVLRENNSCGYANGSWWARGTAWAVYGYSILASYTESEEFAKLAEDIARAYMTQLKDGKYTPVWDFRLPKDMPAKRCGNTTVAELTWDETNPENCVCNVDTSASAVMACGLIRLYEMTGKEDLLDFAIESINELCDNYIKYDPETEGIMSHQNGQMNYTSYGDYYLVQAIAKLIYNIEECW